MDFEKALAASPLLKLRPEELISLYRLLNVSKKIVDAAYAAAAYPPLKIIPVELISLYLLVKISSEFIDAA